MSHCRNWSFASKGIAFDPESGDSFQLNHSARIILERAREERSPEEIAGELTKKFGVTYERALTDVLEFLVHLDSISEAR